MVCFVLSTGAVCAQDTNADQPEAASSLSAEADAAPVEDAASAYPAGLDDPAIDLDELRMRLIP